MSLEKIDMIREEVLSLTDSVGRIWNLAIARRPSGDGSSRSAIKECAMITENDSVTTKDVHQGPGENMVR